MKEVKSKEKGQHRAGKAVQRQLTAKGREALAQRPKGEANEVEQADNAVEQTVTGSVDEVKGAARRGGQKIKTAHQKKRATIKQREAAQAPHEPGGDQSTAQARPAIRERPQPVQQGRQTRPSPRAKAQKSQTTPKRQPKAAQGTVKERKADSPKRPAAPTPEVYQGKMRQAAVQQRREQVIRQKGEKPPAQPMAKEAPARLDPTPNGSPTQRQPSPPPATNTPPAKPTPPTGKAAPTQPGGSCFAIREKVKAAAPKEKPPRGQAAIKTRQPVEKISGKGPTKPIKTARPGKRVAKATQKQAQKRMKHHSQQKLAQQARKAAQGTVKTAGKAIVAAAKAVAAAIGAIAGVVGGGVLLVALCVVFLVAAVVSSPFGIFFAGQDPAPGAVTPREVVAEVNAEYDAKIEELRSGDYDSVEMTGAAADWRDVLAVFAAKTAGTNDGVDVATLDPDRVERLKAVFWDMTEIETEVQTIHHSDGEGGGWTERILHITVTGQTADAAAAAYGFTQDQQTQLAELQTPENNDLWLSLLYGISGGSGSSGGGRNIVAVALSQIGNVGGQPYWSWYGFASREEWCACFVSWCANECGYIDAGTIPKFAGCGQGSQWFKSRGQWADGRIEPVPGMIIFFDWDGDNGQDGAPDHVGIVERVEHGTVYTVEGNSGDACRERHYTVGHYEIFGYGIPSY